ncbi:hypothetical protein GCM10009676_38740 [Prauserella halophila]|uniref:Uncharacterized protein n=1 Tax=Prauserella halophila TaxID=185641 RepID=A0ABN1WLT5_9PSEU|nr:hypothetical protein [Prauserella halophila]
MRGESVAVAEVAERLDVAGASVTEGEIGTDDDGRGVQYVDQYVLHELLGTHPGQLMSEGQDAHAVDAELSDEPRSSVDSAQRRGVAWQAEYLSRVRIEGDHDRRQAGLAGSAKRVLDQPRVPAVYTVEDSEGDGASWPVGGHLADSMPHRAVSMHFPDHGLLPTAYRTCAD